jgi:tetratricopeptide (TPR) repeat protein
MSINEEYPLSYAAKSMIMAKKEDYRNGLESLIKAENMGLNEEFMRLGGDINDFKLMKAKLLYLNDHSKEAIRISKELVDSGNDTMEIYLILAKSFYKIGKKKLEKNEINYMYKAINANPSIGEAFYYVGMDYYSKNNKIEAIKKFDRAISLNFKSFAMYVTMSKIKIKLGFDKDSLNDINKAISIDVNNGEGYYYKAKIFLSLGNNADALMNAEIAVLKGYRGVFVYLTQGIALYNLGRYREAGTFLDIVMNSGAKIPEMYYYKASICLKSADLTGALKYFNNYLVIRPNDKKVLNLRNDLMRRINNR